MKKKAILAVICSMALCLAACGTKANDESDPKDAVKPVIEFEQTSETEETAESAETSDSADTEKAQLSDENNGNSSENNDSSSGRKDGERFETEIMIEGMTETVGYEHAISKTVGCELDYEYDSLVRNSGSDNECFMSKYDDPKDPMNYLLIKHADNDAETTLAELKGSLSDDFDEVNTEEAELDGVGKCECITASGVKNNKLPAGAMRRVYIIPADKGCITAEVNYTIESAEGFGTRFIDILNTLTFHGENR